MFARSSKFSLFDPAKEMVYIDMSREEKMEGKAAVDLVGSQIGKSGASWMIQAMLVATGSVAAALPFISIAYMMVLGFWIRAVGVLDKELAGQKAEDSTASESVTELEQVKEVVQGPNNEHSSGSWASSAKLVVMGSTDGRADAPNSSH